MLPLPVLDPALAVSVRECGSATNGQTLRRYTKRGEHEAGGEGGSSHTATLMFGALPAPCFRSLLRRKTLHREPLEVRPE